MKMIYKYAFEVTGIVRIDMPMRAQVLTVQTQIGEPCIWAIVEPGEPVEPRFFRVYGTGHKWDTNVKATHYVGTFQLDDGGFIGHLFELLTTGGGEQCREK